MADGRPSMPSPPAAQLLDGLSVIELATYVAGPATAGILADWGAEVIKVEPPGGDPLRWLRADAPGGCSPAFETLNRGKHCIALDIAAPADRALLARLIAGADVFITNLRPRGLVRAGLDWPTLAARHPQLVYASITGYGLTGPDADTPAFDNAAYWSRSGMADVTRPDGSDPFSLRQGSGDQTTALATALGIVTALLARSRGGGGRLVEASLLRTASFVMASDLSNLIRQGRIPPTRPRHRAFNPLNNFFRSRDDRWFFCMPRNNGSDWHGICSAAGVAEIATDARFATDTARADNSAALIALLDTGFGRLDLAEIAARFTAADMVWSPVQTQTQLCDDPQAIAAGCFVEVDDGSGASFRAPAPPVRFDGADVPRRPAVAALGRDTAAIRARFDAPGDPPPR